MFETDDQKLLTRERKGGRMGRTKKKNELKNQISWLILTNLFYAVPTFTFQILLYWCCPSVVVMQFFFVWKCVSLPPNTAFPFPVYSWINLLIPDILILAEHKTIRPLSNNRCLLFSSKLVVLWKIVLIESPNVVIRTRKQFDFLFHNLNEQCLIPVPPDPRHKERKKDLYLVFYYHKVQLITRGKSQLNQWV